MRFGRRDDHIRVRGIETVVTDHCNLKCANCNQASPHLAESFLDPDELKADLASLSQVMRAEEFRLFGGEPLQHPQVDRIVEVIRDSGISRRITLITNGLLLHRASDHLWRSIDRSGCPSIRT